ncbi:NlpC/P60 family protein [Streptomyces sp. NPDC092370]|uniref:C40 family peptidase n=1 Tax=Streptomyces sp. NPDC092370 TaxID=3366016 RepID=UPI00382BC187
MATENEALSPDEVRRYVDNLYDRAENDTGTFNATRAAAIPRQRSAGTRGRSREDTEPALGALTRQWFDAARAKLGPTMPASLPEKRLPVRPDAAPRLERSVRPAERPAEPLALEAPKRPKAPANAAWELTGGSARTTTPALPQLSGRPVAPAAASESTQDESAWRADAHSAPGGDVAAWPLYEPEPAPAPEPGPLPVPQPAALLPIGPAPTATYHTAPYDTGLPDTLVPAAAALAPALPAEPAAAPAPTAPAAAAVIAAPVIWTAGETAFTGVTSAAHDGSWLSPDAGRSTQAERVIAFARGQIGRPCVWGAAGPGSFDAPGLTQAAWKAAGVTLPRATEAQWSAGLQVALTEVQVGDLVFFHDDISHVGIWSGGGVMIHAPGPGARIREESVFFAGQSAIKGVMRPA